MSNKSEYKNVLIAGVWENQNGHLTTMPLDAKGLDALHNALEQGGKFLIRKRSQEQRSKAKNPETTPHYFLEFVPKEEVEAYSERNGKKGI